VYHTCVFCQSDLRTNEVLERFPVGRRVAFDAGKGRLWAVCPRCERWNLAPLETRWEAVEDCERLYRGTRLRVATDNIGLARLSEGLELVRVGKPLRPEFAAWRYGDQFGRRRRRAAIATGVGMTAIGAGVALGAAAGLGVVLLPMASAGFKMTLLSRMVGFQQLTLPHEDGKKIVVSPNDRLNIRLFAGGEGGWGLEVPYTYLVDDDEPQWKAILRARNNIEIGRIRMRGPEAVNVAGWVLPSANRRGAGGSRIRDAVGLVEEMGSGEDFFASAPSRLSQWASSQRFGDNGALYFLPATVRLAMEMAAHEDVERRALEGELHMLEEAWRDAEEIAAIADNMFTPKSVLLRLGALKRRAGG
jgi:hypothetical protein